MAEHLKKYDLFLGGTCGNSRWRRRLIPILETKGIIYFNPVVAEWNSTAQKREDEAKQNSHFMLFVIADPNKNGQHISAYSLVEATVGICKQPEHTIACFLITDDMPQHLQSALKKCQQELQQQENSKVCNSLEDIFQWL